MNNSNSRSKRNINNKPFNLYVKCMVVLDSTVFTKYKSFFNVLDDNLVMQYLKIHFSQLVNAVSI